MPFFYPTSHVIHHFIKLVALEVILVRKSEANKKKSSQKAPINADIQKSHFRFLFIFLHQFYHTSLKYIYQRSNTLLDHNFTLSITLKGGIVMNYTTQIPHLKIMGIQSKIKAFVDNPYIFQAYF